MCDGTRAGEADAGKPIWLILSTTVDSFILDGFSKTELFGRPAK